MSRLLEQFVAFLGSVKTAEAVEPELRSAISVTTGMEAPLARAVGEGHDVIIAGSAGGGKTHLLDQLASNKTLPPLVEWPMGQEPSTDFIRVVPDLTKIASNRRAETFDSRPSSCKAVLVAANEGLLLDLARRRLEPFVLAVQALHLAQRGIERPYDPTIPTVFDVGGFDPIANGVVAQLLNLDLLREAVDATPCKCEAPLICPRRRAWQLLDSGAVRQRVNDLIRVVTLQGQPLLFRSLWDFVADVALGGTCEASPPTSAWFWRVFFGSSELSERIRGATDPLSVVFPRAESHVWYADWLAPDIRLIEGVSFIPTEGGQPMPAEDYRWLKCQLFFVVDAPSTIDVFRDQVDLQLAEAVARGEPQELVEALNMYMSYGTLPGSRSVIDLWTDMGIERRTDRARGEVLLGSVRTEELAVRRSRALVNHPDGLELPGGRAYLVHDASAASFHLTGEVLSLLQSGRSFRTADRPHTDVEWQIARFYNSIASQRSTVDRLEVLALDFEAMEGQRRTYRQSQVLGTIEPTLD